MTNKYAIYCDSLEDEQLLKDWIKKESDLEQYDTFRYKDKKLYFHFPANGYSGFRQDVHIFDSCLPEYNKINIKDFLKEYYMKELPNKWCIAITPENKEILLNYWKTLDRSERWLSATNFLHWLISDKFDGSYLNYRNGIPPYDYTEITIEQFKKHILKENMEQLPKQWVVWNDGSQSFKDTVVHYLNTHYSAEFKGWVKDSWYGVIANQKYQADILVSDPVKITIQEFIKLTTKNMKTELLGLPVIQGEKHHLEAFCKDCEKFGHDSYISPTAYDVLVYNNRDVSEILKSERSFKMLFIGSKSYANYSDSNLLIKEFQLPQDWSVALDFMKENMDRWLKIQEENKEPEFKVGDIVVAGNPNVICDAKGRTGRIESIIPGNHPYNINFGSNLIVWCQIERLATPQEIEEYNNKPKIFKMTSTSGNFELEVSKKGIYYRPEDKYLNVNDIDSIRDPLVPNICYSNGGMGHYPTQITKVDVGCKKDTLVSEWKQVYDYYKSLQV